MHKKTAVGFLLFAARLPPLAGGLLSLLALGGCIAFGAERVTGFAFLGNAIFKVGFYIFLTAACVFFPLFYSAVCFASRSYFEWFAANGCRPCVFFNLRQAFRYLKFIFTKTAYLLLWAVLSFMPSVLVFGGIFAALYAGEMYAPVFISVFVCGVLLFAAGLIFFFAAATRYFMCEYLLCLNPKMPVRDVVAESVFLMRGRTKKTLAFLFSFAPWFVLCVIPFFLPFVYSFFKTACVRLCVRYFGENEAESKKGCAVVYYINAKTLFSEHTDALPDAN